MPEVIQERHTITNIAPPVMDLKEEIIMQCECGASNFKVLIKPDELFPHLLCSGCRTEVGQIGFTEWANDNDDG